MARQSQPRRYRLDTLSFARCEATIIIQRPVAHIEIELVGGRRAHFERDVDPEMMMRVIAALGAGAS